MYFEDLESKLDKILTNAMVMYETLQSITETYDALVNRQMNSIMRVLTLLTAGSAMMAIVTSFYGMNVKLPYMNDQFVWVFLLFAMLLSI